MMFSNFERGHSLPVRRQFIDRPAAIGGGNGSNPLGAEVGEVGGRHHAAEVGGSGKDGLGDRAAIQSLGTIVGDQFERASVIRAAKDFADCRRRATWQEHLGIGAALEQVLVADPIRRYELRYRESAPGVINGRLE